MPLLLDIAIRRRACGFQNFSNFSGAMAVVTEAAFRIFRSPVSTPVAISNSGIDLGVMAKLKPFSSTAVCVLLSSVLLKLTIHFPGHSIF